MGTREAWEREAEDWLRWSRTPEHDHWYFLLNLPRFLEMLPPPPRLIVDIGCGEGRLGAELSSRGYDVIGIDSSPTLVKAAAEHSSAVIQADSAKLPLRPGITETVTFFMSLQDMDDLDNALLEAGRIIRPRGQVHIAIVHPINLAGSFTEKSADADFVVARSYFDDRIKDETFERDGVSMRFVQHHRPLERYFHALERAGFLVRTLNELKANDELIELSAASARWTKVPIFLHLTAIKDRWIETEEGAAGVIFDERGRILLIKENYDRRRYSLPGGAVEPGESPEEAALREIHEETGITAVIEHRIGSYGLDSGLVVHAFRCSITSGSPRVPDSGEIAEVGWYPVDAVPQPVSNVLHYSLPDAVSGARGVQRKNLPRVS